MHSKINYSYKTVESTLDLPKVRNQDPSQHYTDPASLAKPPVGSVVWLLELRYCGLELLQPHLISLATEEACFKLLY